jgi:uncharacterized protein (DUF302 family)
MRKFFLSCILLLFFASISCAANGIISTKSSFDVPTTANRLEKILAKKGMTIFTRIDHAAGAAKVGKKLRPTVMIIFGNPKIGTPLMQSSQTIGIDLPQKALIWEDESGQVWFSYNDPRHLAKRHGINNQELIVKKIEKALANFARKATTIE